MAEYQPNETGPLDGVRVVDLTRLAAGNMLTHMLADFGAEVIKIERPGKGDDLRHFGNAQVWWKEYARSKKSVTLNLKSDEGKELLLKLIDTADVLVENFVPGTLERWGLGPDDLLARRPELIMVRLSGWGQTGPYAQKPGFGSLIEGLSGFAAMTGFPDRPPLLPPLALADMIAGITGFGAVSTALYARLDGKSKGQVIDLSLFEPLFSVLGPWLANYVATGTVPQREGNRSEVAAPRNVYTTSDGRFLALSASMQSMWEKLAISIGHGALIEDPRYLTNSDRVRHADELDEVIGGFIAARTLDENIAFFTEEGITVGPIGDPEQLLNHEYIRGRGVVEDYPDADLGQVPLHAPFPRLSATPGSVRAPAPEVGQHNDEFMQELGLVDRGAEWLKNAGVA
ncbi:CoA transferase [Mameliella alba]|nr:CoA transferase [Mameliella alba]MBY6168823.1 CoA transferase [Mameliella alba]MBY6173956.1 CoA transferase [Mameliella alba]